jgi:hypothetical protein
MSQTFEVALRVVLVGAGATIVMDAWLLLLQRCGVPTQSFALLGRWIGHLRRGQWRHDSIAKAAPISGELWIGWCAHYAIGVAFAALLVALWDWTGCERRRCFPRF